MIKASVWVYGPILGAVVSVGMFVAMGRWGFLVAAVFFVLAGLEEARKRYDVRE